MKTLSLLFCALVFAGLSFAQQKTADSRTDGKYVTVNGAKK